jgi:hypothetical protein
MRQEVTATTNKIESYHAFTKWLDFGGDVITENDLNEQQKRIRYIDLVASAVILQNTVDMMRIIQELYAEGENIAVEDAAFMSPYGTTGVKRFGNYHLDLKRPPEAWLKESLFRQAAKRAGNKRLRTQKEQHDNASPNYTERIRASRCTGLNRTGGGFRYIRHPSDGRPAR